MKKFFCFMIMNFFFSSLSWANPCKNNVCVGDTMIHSLVGTIEYPYTSVVTVLGLNQNDVTIRYEDSYKKDKLEVVPFSQLSKTNGCLQGSKIFFVVCVKSEVLIHSGRTRAVVVGVPYSQDGVVKGAVVSYNLGLEGSPDIKTIYVPIHDLFSPTGCLIDKSYCVKDRALLTLDKDPIQVEIAGIHIQSDGELLIRYLEGRFKDLIMPWKPMTYLNKIQVVPAPPQDVVDKIKSAQSTILSTADLVAIEKELQFPERTPLTLPEDLVLPRNERGAAYKVPRKSGVTCWAYVKQSYPNEEPTIGYRTATIKQVRLTHNSTGIFVEFLDDPNLEGVRCFADDKKSIPARTRENLIKIINENGFKLSLPASSRI